MLTGSCARCKQGGKWLCRHADSEGHYWWEPQNCRLRRFSGPEARQCLNGRHIFFGGDSLTRCSSFLACGWQLRSPFPPLLHVPQTGNEIHFETRLVHCRDVRTQVFLSQRSDLTKFYASAADTDCSPCRQEGCPGCVSRSVTKVALQIPVSVLCELPLKRGVHGPMGPRGRQVSGCGARMGWVGRLLQVRLPHAGSGEPTLVAVFTSDVRSQAVA